MPLTVCCSANDSPTHPTLSPALSWSFCAPICHFCSPPPILLGSSLLTTSGYPLYPLPCLVNPPPLSLTPLRLSFLPLPYLAPSPLANSSPALFSHLLFSCHLSLMSIQSSIFALSFSSLLSLHKLWVVIPSPIISIYLSPFGATLAIASPIIQLSFVSSLPNYPFSNFHAPLPFSSHPSKHMGHHML